MWSTVDVCVVGSVAYFHMSCVELVPSVADVSGVA